MITMNWRHCGLELEDHLTICSYEVGTTCHDGRR